MQVPSVGWEDSCEPVTTCPVMLAWKEIPWTEEPEDYYNPWGQQSWTMKQQHFRDFLRDVLGRILATDWTSLECAAQGPGEAGNSVPSASVCVTGTAAPASCRF